MSFDGTPQTQVDQDFFQRELDSFLPDRIYDAHCHLWRHACVPWAVPASVGMSIKRAGGFGGR